MMFSEKFSIVCFLLLVVFLVWLDLNNEVKVTVCESGGLTTYVGKMEPGDRLKLGKCSLHSMFNSEYYELKRMMK
jgi:hypothetical protein